jgi:hypothetical protein
MGVAPRHPVRLRLVRHLLRDCLSYRLDRSGLVRRN